ncbi:hypothetical protein [Amycolatopsis sp. YIM 10]|uniref:phthiocerol/phthiodiolone dimycocerosyl transferase family protein n=1 Tax=Amycolatopsis sp. YIM 10 TaxID=2653857 RepID=UPI0012905410|nr:hypothetical protein [Amycolatopsis sp. YIM 10]QFU91729.1 acyltransferase PapA5 [Amycolatopsis sp. YIM 10]
METELTTLERPLNFLELAHLDRVVIMAAEYDGELDTDRLERAFQLLCAAYPVLRARIRGGDHEPALCVPRDHQPALRVLADEPGVLAKIAGLPWDAHRAVADLVVARGEKHGFLALRMDHSITDANAWLGMFRELLRVFAAVAEGSEAELRLPPGDRLPSPPAELFHQRLGLIPYDRRLFHSAERSALAPDGPGELFSGRIDLDEGQTSWLKLAARRYGTTVHGVVCGAILLAQRALAGGPDPARMYCVSPVDFRGRVEPPVGDLETTNYMLSYVAEVEVSTRMSPVTIGRAIKAQMDDILAAAEGVRSTTPPDCHLGRNLSYALVSNLGVINRFPEPAGLSITDFQVLNTVGNTLFPGYYVSTFGGRLTVLYVLTAKFFDRVEVDRLTREIHDQLLIVGASS